MNRDEDDMEKREKIKKRLVDFAVEERRISLTSMLLHNP